MATFSITYILNEKNQKGQDIEETITDFDESCHLFDGAWMVRGNFSLKNLEDSFRKYVTKEDRFVIAEIGDVVWLGLTDDETRWLRKNRNLLLWLSKLSVWLVEMALRQS